MESDHTPAAFSPPTTDGDTNLTQPCTCGEPSPDNLVVHRTDGPCYLRGSGEQPTSVEAILDDYHSGRVLADNEHWFTLPMPREKAIARLELMIAEERRQAKLAPDTVTRFELIDHTENGLGRLLTKHNVAVELSYQDDDRTLKVFLRERGENNE